MQEEGFRNKEYVNPIKEKILYKLWDTLNVENQLSISVNPKKGYAKLFKY